MTRQPTRRAARRWQLAVLIVAVSGLTGFTAVSTNALGAADRFDRLVERISLFVDPPPDRPTVATVVVTPQPSAASAAPIAAGPGLEGPGDLPSRAAAPSTTPAPVRAPVSVRLVEDANAVFASQLTDKDCAVAATQMVLTILGLGNTSPEFQQEIKGRISEWESVQDSHNGGWGPNAMRLALQAYGAPGYEARAYWSHTDAMRDSAAALSRTGKPVVLFPWWGAHAWVMTGYEADADPTVFADAWVTGLYILDPWFERTSSIWGPSDPPGTFQSLAEMERNWPYGTSRDGWSRPGGVYPERDGRYVVLIPTTPLASGEGAFGS